MTIYLEKAYLYLNCYHQYIQHVFAFQYEYPKPKRWGTISLGQPVGEASSMYVGTRFSREELIEKIGPLVELECTEVKTWKASSSSIRTDYVFDIKRFEGGGAISLNCPEEEALHFQVGQTISFPAFIKLLDKEDI